MQGMALGTMVDSNALSYPVLVFMKEQGVAVGRGGALALGGQARQNQSSVVRTRSVVAFLSDRKRQRSMVINSTSLGTPVLGPRQLVTRRTSHALLRESLMKLYYLYLLIRLNKYHKWMIFSILMWTTKYMLVNDVVC